MIKLHPSLVTGVQSLRDYADTDIAEQNSEFLPVTNPSQPVLQEQCTNIPRLHPGSASYSYCQPSYPAPLSAFTPLCQSSVPPSSTVCGQQLLGQWDSDAWIVSEMITASWLAGCLMQLVSNPKVNLS